MMSLVRVQLGELDRKIELYFGSVVKRLRHRPFTAVTRVRFPSESFRFIILDSSMVEHSAVNRVVVGSSPTGGAMRHPRGGCLFFVQCGFYRVTRDCG